jgi:dihydroflavonol-4-reductase
MAAVQRGLEAVIVNPTVVMGQRDTYLQNSRIILEVARGRIPLIPPGGINVVDALDLARGHLLAFEAGRPGERYLLAGHNVSNVALANEIAEVLSVRPPRGAIPLALITPMAQVLDTANRVWPRPLPLSGDLLRMGARCLYADNSKAVGELGFSVTPLRVTIEGAVSWLREEGHLA